MPHPRLVVAAATLLILVLAAATQIQAAALKADSTMGSSSSDLTIVIISQPSRPSPPPSSSSSGFSDALERLRLLLFGPDDPFSDPFFGDDPFADPPAAAPQQQGFLPLDPRDGDPASSSRKASVRSSPTPTAAMGFSSVNRAQAGPTFTTTTALLNPGRTSISSPPAATGTTTTTATGSQSTATSTRPGGIPPPSPTAVCGDGICQAGETCGRCAGDCGMIVDNHVVRCDMGLQRCIGLKQVVMALSNPPGSDSMAALPVAVADDLKLKQIPYVLARAPPTTVPNYAAQTLPAGTVPARLLLPFLLYDGDPALLLNHPGVSSLVYYTSAANLTARAQWFTSNNWTIVSEQRCRTGADGPLLQMAIGAGLGSEIALDSTTGKLTVGHTTLGAWFSSGAAGSSMGTGQMLLTLIAAIVAAAL
ncbi:hypothetical protein BC828DRAFT_380519 [Blastocladiella britannica]|nr:hypothetical protein BC828DRAFT_380519 [Blastocladiella britannica]